MQMNRMAHLPKRKENHTLNADELGKWTNGGQLLVHSPIHLAQAVQCPQLQGNNTGKPGYRQARFTSNVVIRTILMGCRDGQNHEHTMHIYTAILAGDGL
jgi:hypothetical protein